MNTKLKCLLLDDELTALTYTKMLCEQIPNVEVVKAFNNPIKFLKTIPELDFNTCILDIHMQDLNGLAVAKHLRDKLVIFTTAYKEFAAEAFDLNAVDYLRKPLQKDRFEKAIAKAFGVLGNKIVGEKKQILWNSDQGKTLVNIEDILYIKSSDIDSRDKNVFLKNNRKILVKNTNFDQIMEALSTLKFCRINKKEIISLNTVQHYTADKIMTNIFKEPLVLSEVYSDAFKQQISLVQKK